MLSIRTDRTSREWYSQGAGIYRIVPAAVARPPDTTALAEVLLWARERGMPVTARGAGTAMPGSNVGDGLVVDLTAIATREPEVDPDRRSVRVDAGISLRRVAEATARHGLRFGPDPSSAAWATVGGVIATNAAGPRSHRLGAVDRWVLEVELLTADGAVVVDRDLAPDSGHLGVQRFERDAVPLLRAHRTAVLARAPATRKDTAGFGLRRWHRHGHLLDLVIGSEGTLGIVTEARLRLEATPAHRATLELRLRDRSALVAVLETLAEVTPVAVELFDRSFLTLVADAHPATHTGPDRADALLLVDLEDDEEAELAGRVARVAARVARDGVTVRVADGPAEAAALWSLRHRASPILAGLRDGRRSLQVIEDGCVPVPALPAYLDAVDAACREAAVDHVMFGHAGDGHVHVNLLPDLTRPDWLAGVRRVYRTVTEAQLALGGTPAGEHGTGRLRTAVLERFVGPEAMACMQAVKRAFDPAGLFNPGVIVDGSADPLARLKVGPQAVPIAPSVAAALQRIEAERDWGTSRWPAA